MAKINITKVTGGTESLNLISAFKSDGTTKVVFDSERIGSMGLPIIYISKYTDKLEKIVDDNEWQSVKNNLKGIINGTNFEYVTIPENVSSDDVYYTPLTLPAASFDAIKNNYVVPTATEVKEPNMAPTEPIMPDNNVASNRQENVIPAQEVPTVSPIPNVPPVAPTAPIMEPVMPEVETVPAVTPIAEEVKQEEFVAPVAPEIPPVAPIAEPVEAPVSMPEPPAVAHLDPVMPTVSPVEPVVPSVTDVKPVMPVNPPVNPAPAIQKAAEAPVNLTTINFDTDKETFLKACENMFDALVAKYQKELMELEKREQALAVKEQEINNKMHEANEALANAEAREQVANIAHDNAQKVMDFSTIMPHPTPQTETTV